MVGEHDLQLIEHHVPILIPGMPVLDDPSGSQIQHPTQRIVIGERRLVLGDLPELPVQSFDDVRRVYDFPNFRRIFKERTQNLPILLPPFDCDTAPAETDKFPHISCARFFSAATAD